MKTNRALLLCIVLLLVGVRAHSQQLFWIKGGANISRVTGNKSNMFSPQAGYQLGVGFEKIFSDPLGLKMELFLNEKGFHSENVAMPNTQDGLIDNHLQQTSLLVPIIGTLHFKRWFFEGGFSFDFTLRSNQVLMETYNSSKPTPVVEIQENVHEFNNPELGYLVGAGVQVYKGL
ncbi:MAG: outer membrane beta-barrel protein, partial [Bacteroidales bacterium]